MFNLAAKTTPPKIVRVPYIPIECQRDDFDRVTAIPWSERRAAVQVRGFILNSDHLASFGSQLLRVGVERVDVVTHALAKRIKDLKFHQQLAAKQEGPAILVAPTGSGKTEAGMLWAARQAEAGLRGRTFVLLPYQASMNAMQRRLVADFAPHLLNNPSAWDKEVALVHGRSMRTWTPESEWMRHLTGRFRRDIEKVLAASTEQFTSKRRLRRTSSGGGSAFSFALCVTFSALRFRLFFCRVDGKKHLVSRVRIRPLMCATVRVF